MKNLKQSLQDLLIHTKCWLRGKPKDIMFVNPHYQHIFSSSQSRPELHIYCIHGTADRSFAFNFIAQGLLSSNDFSSKSNRLPKNVAAIHLLSFEGRCQGQTIADYVEQLKKKIMTNNHKDIILMGHSRGGVVAAAFTEQEAKKAGITVHGVLTFCSPFQGTRLANYFSWLYPPLKEMENNSKYLQYLRQSILGTNNNANVYFYFGADKDAIVPIESTYVGDLGNWVLLQNQGHLSILNSVNTIQHVEHCLHKICDDELLK